MAVILVYDDKGILKCPNCPSRTFDMVAELRVTAVSKNGENNDPVANHTILSQRIISLICAKCGAKLI